MLEIAICDDNKNFIETIEKLVSEYMQNQKIDFSLMTFTQATDLMLSDCVNYDIIFLDVEIGNDNGIEIAKEIKRINKKIIIVYISRYVQYAPYGYNVKAFAYLLKDNLTDMFNSTIQAVLNEIKFKDSVYEFVNEKILITIPLREILCFESFDKIIEITTIDKNYSFRGKISDVEKEVLHKGFLKAHKSYLINIEHINSIKNYIIKLSNGEKKTVSQKRWKDAVKAYLEWKSRI